MWGQPHLLAACTDALADFDACEANEQAMAALCQVGTSVHADDEVPSTCTDTVFLEPADPSIFKKSWHGRLIYRC